MLWTDKVKKILLKYWNYDKLKDKQISVINEILSGNDVVGLLPTGYGKSLCYILPPLLTKKTIFIISPLISLMDDQKDKLLKLGIPVSALHGNNINKENEIKEILEGKIKIVYMSPEYIIDGYGLELAKTLYEKNILGYLAIDESHCLSSWGHDFRPQYLKLKDFRNLFPDIPIMAVTATAKEMVVKEIIKFLELKNPKIIRANFDRPNLYIECNEVERIPNKKKKGAMTKKPYDEIIRNYINKYENDRIIIYVNSRKETEDIVDKLNLFYNKQISNSYHAGLNKKTRDQVALDFINNKCNIIISTVAFGMGIDQIVKCVLIFGCSSSIEEYYQQIGRGGRDGSYCETVFYYDNSKRNMKRIMIDKETNNQVIKKNKHDNLQKVEEYFNTKTCRRQFILNYLGLSKNYFVYNGFTCLNCDNCNKHNLVDITYYIWEHYINNKPINKKIEVAIKNFKLEKIIFEWVSYIKFKGYTLTDIPENMKIKLRLDNNEFTNEDLIYDKFSDINI